MLFGTMKLNKLDFSRPHSPEWVWISISEYQSQIKNQAKRDCVK